MSTIYKVTTLLGLQLQNIAIYRSFLTPRQITQHTSKCAMNTGIIHHESQAKLHKSCRVGDASGGTGGDVGWLLSAGDNDGSVPWSWAGE